MSNCTFKATLETDCYEGGQKKLPLIQHDQLEPDEWVILLWKAKGTKSIVQSDITICKKHKLRLQGMFRGNHCSDPFSKHKDSAATNSKNKAKVKVGE